MENIAKYYQYLKQNDLIGEVNLLELAKEDPKKLKEKVDKAYAELQSKYNEYNCETVLVKLSDMELQDNPLSSPNTFQKYLESGSRKINDSEFLDGNGVKWKIAGVNSSGNYTFNVYGHPESDDPIQFTHSESLSHWSLISAEMPEMPLKVTIENKWDESKSNAFVDKYYKKYSRPYQLIMIQYLMGNYPLDETDISKSQWWEMLGQILEDDHNINQEISYNGPAHCPARMMNNNQFNIFLHRDLLMNHFNSFL